MKINLIKVTFVLLTVFTAGLHTQDFWQQVNGPFGGNINKVVSAPNGNLYAITYSAIFKSTNEGTGWAQVTPPSINNIMTGDVAPNGYVYAATGGNPSKIFRSTDEGASWQERLPNGGYNFNDMTVTPGGTVLAGTFYMFSFHGQFIQSGDIYRSQDNGNTFSAASFPDLAIGSIEANTNGDIYVATISGLFKSVNGGISWGLIRNDTCSKIFTSSAGHIFFSARQLVYRSTNHGGSWESVNPKLPMASAPDGSLFTAEGGKIFKSTDNGNSWNQIAIISNAPLFDVYSILSAGNKLFTGSDLGVHKSENSGINWVEVNNGIRISNINAVAIRGSNIFTASDRFISKSTDNGVSWINLINGVPEFGAYEIKINNNGTVFAFFNGSGLFRSTNNGDLWVKITALPAEANTGLMDFNSSSQIFVAGLENVYKSTDNGTSWNIINNGLPADQPFFSGLSVDEQNNVYVSVRWGGFNTQDGLFKSANGGTSWTQINNIVVNANFKFNSAGHMFSITGNGLLRSTNGGANFEILSSAPDYCLELEIGNEDQIFLHYVENEIYGIKRSYNNGNTWAEFTQGLGQLFIYDFAFDNNSFLLAATQSGLFKTINSTLGIKVQNSGTPAEYALGQNFPNPFNPETIIRFSIPKDEFTRLSVYNSLGEEIDVLINSNLNSGNYEINWDASGYASGIYFYKLETDDYSSVKKMILLK
jgi:photosystem II stability/assembly factor-like uncharacterized protein